MPPNRLKIEVPARAKGGIPAYHVMDAVPMPEAVWGEVWVREDRVVALGADPERVFAALFPDTRHLPGSVPGQPVLLEDMGNGTFRYLGPFSDFVGE